MTTIDTATTTLELVPMLDIDGEMRPTARSASSQPTIASSPAIGT